MRKFIALAGGLLASILGSAFTGLAMGTWVFQHTGSATQYGITLVINLLPGIVFGPVAGALVDRYSRRAILIGSELVSAVTVLGLALLYAAGALQPWHIFVVVGIQSLVRALQLPALSSVVVLLAPKDQVSRANGFVMLAQALGNTVGFAAGGVLLLAIQLDGVLLVDFATFLVNILILAFVRIPRPPRSETASEAEGRGLLAEIRVGFRVLGTRRALRVLLLFSAALNLSLGFADAMLTPLVLSFASAAALGLVVASMGIGAVLGSTALAMWGGPRRRVNGLAGFALPLGLFLCVGALRPSIPLIVVAALGFTFCFTITDGTNRNILQLEVEPDVQGRVFATYNVVSGAVLAVAYVLAGPVADRVFEPLLRPEGSLAGSVGSVLGTGPGRGMAFLMLLVGVVMLITAALAFVQPSLRRLADRPATRREPEEARAAAVGEVA
ncbi:MFS transporter [Amycolatopsis sacchari]|uniref:MFS transporter n=1 Tax=Amycolatopsis sacchari TaxID=115433 RepID=UPI003D73E839